MALQKFEFSDLDIDIEFEVTGGIFKFFPHKQSDFFGQCVLSTGEIGDGIVKGLETPHISFKRRKQLNTAIRRTMKALNYSLLTFQRKVPGKPIRTFRQKL